MKKNACLLLVFLLFLPVCTLLLSAEKCRVMIPRRLSAEDSAVQKTVHRTWNPVFLNNFRLSVFPKKTAFGGRGKCDFAVSPVLPPLKVEVPEAPALTGSGTLPDIFSIGFLKRAGPVPVHPIRLQTVL